MPNLYIANCTKQVKGAFYRLDFNAKGMPEQAFRPAKMVTIQPGRQIVIRDLHMQQVESIVRQLSKHGMIAVNEVARTDQKAAMIFNVDKVVPGPIIQDVLDMNAGLLTLEGVKRRKSAAIATNNIVQNAVESTLAAQQIPVEADPKVTVEFEQEEQSPAGERRIAEGYVVDENAPNPNQRRFGRGPGRPKGSRNKRQ